MNVGEILGVISLAVSIPIAIGAGLALVRASYNKAQAEQLRRHNEDLRNRVEDLEVANKSLMDKNEHFEDQVEVLAEMVTQRADLQVHHRTVMENYDAMATLLGKILSSVQEVLDHVKR